MPSYETSGIRSRATGSLAERFLNARRSAESQRTAVLEQLWWKGVLTFATALCIVASQALMNVPGWSRMGILSSILVLALIVMGRMKGYWTHSVGKWWLIPTTFIIYFMVRSVPEAGEEWPVSQMFQSMGAFLTGLGIVLAFQVAVPFKAIAYAQIASNLISVIGEYSGIAAQAESRHAGVTGNANEFGLQLTLGACVIWLLPKRSGLIVSLLAVAVAAHGVVSSGSRTTLAVFPFFMVMCCLQIAGSIRNHRAFLAFLGLASLVIITVVGALLAPILWDQIREITSVKRVLDYQDSSFHIRYAMVRTGLRLWREAPIFGQGSDAFTQISGFGTYAHNNYVELLCNLGVVGVILYYGLHFFILLRALLLPVTLRLYCWGFVVVLLATDTGSISHDRKQSAMILMLLASLVAWYRQGESRDRFPSAGLPATLRRPEATVI